MSVQFRPTGSLTSPDRRITLTDLKQLLILMSYYMEPFVCSVPCSLRIVNVIGEVSFVQRSHNFLHNPQMGSASCVSHAHTID